MWFMVYKGLTNMVFFYNFANVATIICNNYFTVNIF